MNLVDILIDVDSRLRNRRQCCKLGKKVPITSQSIFVPYAEVMFHSTWFGAKQIKMLQK